MSDTLKIFQCACSGEGLTLDYDEEDGLLISLWRIGERATDWRTKLRHIREILKNGHPFTDDIILSRETTYELMLEISQQLANADTQSNQTPVA